MLGWRGGEGGGGSGGELQREGGSLVSSSSFLSLFVFGEGRRGTYRGCMGFSGSPELDGDARL